MYRNKVFNMLMTVLYSVNKKYYVAVNDVDGSICDELIAQNDTKILKMLTMWKIGGVDLSAYNFRRALVELNQENNNAEMVLQGKDSLIVKKLSVTMS